jgi:hypothetical protein
MLEDFSVREVDDAKSDDPSFSKIDVAHLGSRGEVFCEQELRNRPPSSSARWYYDEEDMILNHDIGDFPRAVLAIVTLRLGLNEIDSDYFESVKACFDLPQCVGLLGGKPNFALYFVGTQDDSLIFLDPHFVQDAVPSEEDLPAYESTYFT